MSLFPTPATPNRALPRTPGLGVLPPRVCGPGFHDDPGGRTMAVMGPA